METDFRIYPSISSVKHNNIGSDNVLSPGPYEVIWTNARVI